MVRVPSKPSAPGAQASKANLAERKANTSSTRFDSRPTPLSKAICFGIAATVSAASAPPSMTVTSGGRRLLSSGMTEGRARPKGVTAMQPETLPDLLVLGERRRSLCVEAPELTVEPKSRQGHRRDGDHQHDDAPRQQGREP